MRTRHHVVFAASFLLAACAGTGEHRTDSSAGAVDTTHAATTATAPNSVLRNVAGKWNMTARPTTGRDSTPTHVVLNATADTTGWTMVLGGQTVALHVSLARDTIVATSDEYSSARRPGVRVRTNSKHVLQGDRLVGTTIAHYMVKGADSVLILKTEATRAP